MYWRLPLYNFRMEARASSVYIREYSPDFRERILSLWSRSFGKSRMFLDDDLERACKASNDMFILAVDGNEVIGTVIIAHDGYRGWIYYLTVAPGYRRQGIARLLLEQGERKLRDLGCSWVNLQVRQGNRDVLGFYLRQGYRKDNTISLSKCLSRKS